jgi:hypothetical protein
MTFAPLLGLTLIACVVAIVVPHHVYKPDSFKKNTLAAIYVDMYREIPRTRMARIWGFLILYSIGVVSSFYPAILVAMLRWVVPTASGTGGLWFVGGGLSALVGAAVNLLLILLSHVNFAWGGSSSTKDQTIFAWLLPLSQAVVAILSIVVGFSATCALFARSFVH